MFSALDPLCLENGVKLTHFLFAEWRRTRQLTQWRKKQNKAKSRQSYFASFARFLTKISSDWIACLCLVTLNFVDGSLRLAAQHNSRFLFALGCLEMIFWPILVASTVAQWIVQRTHALEIPGSSPMGGILFSLPKPSKHQSIWLFKSVLSFFNLENGAQYKSRFLKMLELLSCPVVSVSSISDVQKSLCYNDL